MTDARHREFEELVVRYQGVVCAVAFAVLRDRARSEEVAQEAFLVAWQKLPALAVPPQLPGWLCGIARNLARNAARRRQETAMDHEPAATTATPLDAMIDRECEALARDALASLRERDREVVVLYYRGNDSIADVAATLGISEAAAKQRLHRGRERLKSALASVELALRGTRPGPAFTAACVAALAVRGAIATAAPQRGTWPGLKAASIVGVVAAGGAVALAVASPATSAPAASTHAAAAAPRREHTAALARAHAALPRKLVEPTRTAIVARIASARAARLASTPMGTTSGDEPIKIYDFAGHALDAIDPTAPAELTKLDKHTLRYAIRSVQPLLLECYAAAYDRLPHQPATLALRIELSGEPGVATLVDHAEITGDAHFAADAELVECVRESLLSIELPALDPGGRVAVHYPFAVSGKPVSRDRP